jgi:hypothetical protein
MLDNISKATPAITLIAVAAFSIFNIGYFWKVGIHFLGVLDFSNLVYTFGLSMTFLFILLHLGAFVARKQAGPVRLLLLGLLGTGFTFLGIFGPKLLDISESVANAIILIGLCISLSGFSGWAWARYEAFGIVRGDIVLFILLAVATIFQAGLFTASFEMASGRTYQVSTARGVIDGVRILKSSSAGFVLLADNRVMFVPQSQIREIVENQK